MKYLLIIQEAFLVEGTKKQIEELDKQLSTKDKILLHKFLYAGDYKK